jgi:hypothetical protein
LERINYIFISFIEQNKTMSHFQFEPCSGGSDDSDDEYCFFEDKSSKDQNKEINQLNPNLGIIFVNIANI